MGTEPATPDGTGRADAGPVRLGYREPGPSPFVLRHQRLILGIVGAFLVLFLVGLALLARPLLADEDGFGFPSGVALAQFVIGAAVTVAGVLLWMRSLRRSVVRRPAGRPLELPRSVRRAVRRREAVPEEFRAHIPTWLDQLRTMGWMLTGQMVSMCGFNLAMTAAGGGWDRVLFWFGVSAALYLVFIGVPLVLFRRWLTRTRRHYAAAA